MPESMAYAKSLLVRDDLIECFSAVTNPTMFDRTPILALKRHLYS
jgi:hypothetical protein